MAKEMIDVISELAEKFIQAKHYSQGRNGMKICKITPHIMASKWTGTRCAEFFAEGTRQASANYCIGKDGDIVCSVKEEDRAWTSTNGNNDRQAITIECANDVLGGEWHISDATWNSLVNLCVDVCRRYNFKLVYDGTSNGSLTRHNMFANTNCPGPYLQSRLEELAEIVNRRLEKEKMIKKLCDKYGEENVDKALSYFIEAFINADETSEWAKEELKEAVELKITDGTKPKLPATREQTAIMITRAVKMLKQKNS